jgi:hypothetical protein
MQATGRGPFGPPGVGAGGGVRHHRSVRLDHVSYAVSNAELADTVQRIGLSVQSTFQDGGRHPRFGTRNFVLPLDNGCYIEVVSPLDHPAVDAAPFGQAVKSRVGDGGGWLGWVVAVDDIAPLEHRFGREAVKGHRVRPDGYDLCWRQLGIKDLMVDPQLPFFIQWDTPEQERPSAGASSISLEALEISGDAKRVEEWLGGAVADVVDGVEIRWVDAEEPGLIAVHVRTPEGSIRLD